MYYAIQFAKRGRSCAPADHRNFAPKAGQNPPKSPLQRLPKGVTMKV